MSLSNQKCMIQPSLINLHPQEYSQKFHYYPFAIKLVRCVGSCNTFNDLSNKVRVPNKTKALNLSMFNMITGLNESKTLTRHILYECKCKFDGRKCNSNQWSNNDKCQCEREKHQICEKDYIWNPATCSCKNGKYLASITDKSVITGEDIIEEETKTVTTNFNEKTNNFYILLAFLLITSRLLIAVSIYCYLIKYKTKQKYLLPFHVTNSELK